MTPAGVAAMTGRGHEVYVQHTAGDGSGFSDDEYVGAGAKIVPTIEDVYREAEMIVKVKEPIEPEYDLVRKGQLLFTYFHFACEKELTYAMLKSGAICLAYETVQLPNGTLPLLQPMSEVAGRMATLNGAYYLQKTKGGKGKLISGVPGVSPARVLAQHLNTGPHQCYTALCAQPGRQRMAKGLQGRQFTGQGSEYRRGESGLQGRSRRVRPAIRTSVDVTSSNPKVQIIS